MRLRELFENIYEAGEDKPFDNSLKTIGICFGRFNPPHHGHREVWKSAASNPIWYVGTNDSTSGPKDPLPYEIKLQAMAAVWPKVAGHVIPEQSLLTLASRVYQEHGQNVHLKVYTDEEWLYKTLAQYNGVQGKAHGTYKFNQIDWVKTQRLASATDLRAAVRAGDRKSFYHNMGIKPSVTININNKEYPVFDVVAHYLNQYPEVKKKVAEGTTNAAGIRATGVMKKIDPTQKAAMKNAITLPAMNQSTGSAYLGWRLGIALAGAPDYPTKAEADNWIGGDPLLSTYTEEEFEMVQAASLAVGGGKIENWSGKRSEEIPGIQKVSPTAKLKRNKYGI
jgi:nicotinamide mononucleotide adenylyltransferase